MPAPQTSPWWSECFSLIGLPSFNSKRIVIRSLILFAKIIQSISWHPYNLLLQFLWLTSLLMHILLTCTTWMIISINLSEHNSTSSEILKTVGFCSGYYRRVCVPHSLTSRNSVFFPRSVPVFCVPYDSPSKQRLLLLTVLTIFFFVTK
jgi:hypothetical protein